MESLAKCEDLPDEDDDSKGEWQVMTTDSGRIGTIYTNGTHSQYVADGRSDAKGLVVRFCGAVRRRGVGGWEYVKI